MFIFVYKNINYTKMNNIIRKIGKLTKDIHLLRSEPTT